MDMALHEQMIEAIVAVASELPSAIHVANCIQKLLCVPAHGSAMNFHYAIPSAMRENWHLGVIIGEDETSFRGNSAGSYRSEHGVFVGGKGIFSHLDYGYIPKKRAPTIIDARDSCGAICGGMVAPGELYESNSRHD